jgi:hypothetical protein
VRVARPAASAAAGVPARRGRRGRGDLEALDEVAEEDEHLALRVVGEEEVDEGDGVARVGGGLVHLGDGPPGLVEEGDAERGRGRDADKGPGERAVEVREAGAGGLGLLAEGDHGLRVRGPVLRVEAVDDVQQDDAVAAPVPVLLHHRLEDLLGAAEGGLVAEPPDRGRVEVQVGGHVDAEGLEAGLAGPRGDLVEGEEVVAQAREDALAPAHVVAHEARRHAREVPPRVEGDEGVPNAADRVRDAPQSRGEGGLRVPPVLAEEAVALEEGHLDVEAREELADARRLVELREGWGWVGER